MSSNPIDPFLASVMQRAFKSITDEMSMSMLRTTRSPILCEAREFVTGLYDADGHMLEQTENLPILSFSLGPVCKHLVQYFGSDIHPGDVILHNDVFSFGNQNNDVAAFKPIFLEGTLIGWSATTGHMADIGGAVRGGYSGGSATVPSLGVRYGPVNGRFTLSGDSILVDSLRINGERGGANITGQVWLDRLTRPILGLDMRARGFSVMDVPGFLTLELDADAQFRGPLVQPVLTGRGTVRNTVLYFADLVSKSIVNLEDPLYADLVDTLALREGGLRSEFQSRFLDSLTIRNLSFRAAEGVWLRSSEANIQLEGQANVNKVRQIHSTKPLFPPRAARIVRLPRRRTRHAGAKWGRGRLGTSIVGGH